MVNKMDTSMYPVTITLISVITEQRLRSTSFLCFMIINVDNLFSIKFREDLQCKQYYLDWSQFFNGEVIPRIFPKHDPRHLTTLGVNRYKFYFILQNAKMNLHSQQHLCNNFVTPL